MIYDLIVTSSEMMYDLIVTSSEMPLTECGEDGGVFMPGSGGPKYCEARPEVPTGIHCKGWSGKSVVHVVDSVHVVNCVVYSTKNLYSAQKQECKLF